MMELSYANTTEIGFLERDSRHLQLDPLKPSEEALFIATPDGEGITLIGTREDLMDFALKLMHTVAQLPSSDWSEQPEGGYKVSAPGGLDPDPGSVQFAAYQQEERDA